MTFKVGDRVRLARPEDWLQPYRKWAQTGRQAVVIYAAEPIVELGSLSRHLRIRFAHGPRIKDQRDYELVVNPRHIVAVESAPNLASPAQETPSPKAT